MENSDAGAFSENKVALVVEDSRELQDVITEILAGAG